MKNVRCGLVMAAVVALALGLVGCTSESAAHRRIHPTYFLAVTVNGIAPTPAELALVRGKARARYDAMGWVLVDDIRKADRVIRVDFLPDPIDPDFDGRIVVVGMYSQFDGRLVRYRYRYGNTFTSSADDGLPLDYRYGYSGYGYGGYGYRGYDYGGRRNFRPSPPSDTITPPSTPPWQSYSSSGDRDERGPASYTPPPPAPSAPDPGPVSSWSAPPPSPSYDSGPAASAPLPAQESGPANGRIEMAHPER